MVAGMPTTNSDVGGVSGLAAQFLPPSIVRKTVNPTVPDAGSGAPVAATDQPCRLFKKKKPSSSPGEATGGVMLVHVAPPSLVLARR